MPEFYTIDELSTRWKGAITKQTMANWRSQGKGPKFIKIGQKVLYRISSVNEFEQKKREV